MARKPIQNELDEDTEKLNKPKKKKAKKETLESIGPYVPSEEELEHRKFLFIKRMNYQKLDELTVDEILEHNDAEYVKMFMDNFADCYFVYKCYRERSEWLKWIKEDADKAEREYLKYLELITDLWLEKLDVVKWKNRLREEKENEVEEVWE